MIRYFFHPVFLLCIFPTLTYGQWSRASSGAIRPFSNVWEITTFYDYQNVFNILAAAGTAGAFRSTDKGLNWIAMNSGLNGARVISIASVPRNQSPPILLAATEEGAYSNGRILRSTNYGSTWTTVFSFPGTWTGCFTYYPNGTGGWNIFAGLKYVYRSTDDGLTWTQTSVWQPKSLIAIPDGSGGTNIFAGTQSTIYKSTDNGVTWFLSNTGLHSLSIWGLAWLNNTLFAATNGIYKSTDYGLNWSFVSGTSSLSFSKLFQAEGKLYAGTFGGGLYVSPDSGVSWIHANGVPNGFRLSALAAIPYLSETKILAGFESGSNLYISVNDTTWEIFGSPELGMVYCLNQDDQYIFALSLRDVFYSTDNGDSWESIGSGLPLATYCSFAAYPDGTGGRYLFAGAVNGNHIISRSSDMGTHWTNVSNERAYDLALLTGESGVNLFCANYWGVLCSTDNGVSWINKSNGIVSYIETLFAEGSGASARIYAGGQQGKLYYSTNYGDNWNQLTPVSGTIISLLVMGDSIFAGTYNSLFFSTDHGLSWVSAQNGLPNRAINSLLLIPRDIDDHILAGTGVGVFASINGTSWTPVNDGFPSGCEVYSLILKDSTVFAGTNNGVWKRPLNQIIDIVPVELTSVTASVNKSNVTLLWKTSTEVNNRGFGIERRSFNGEFITIGFVKGNGTTTNISSYSFTDEDVANGNYNYRLHQIDYDGTSKYYNVPENIIVNVSQFTLAQNYPNPFNPTTKIKYSIPEDGLVKLKVFNLLGQQVYTLVNEQMKAGTYEVDFNASDFASGVYFYKLETGKLVSIKKLIVLK